MKFPGTQAFVNHLVVYTLVTLAGGGSVGLGAVWMQQRITATAAVNKTLERDLAVLQRRFDDLSLQIEQESNPSILEQRNSQWQLGLDQSPRDKVKLVPGDARLRLADKREGQTARLDLAASLRYSRPEDR